MEANPRMEHVMPRCLALILGLPLALCGCATPSQKSNPAVPQAARLAGEVPATQPVAKIDPAQAWAAKTAEWVQTMQPHLERRNTPTTMPAVESPANLAQMPRLPDVKWPDPGEYQFTLGEPQDRSKAHPAPIAPTPTATRPLTPPEKVATQTVVAVPEPLEARVAKQVRDYPQDLPAQIDYQLVQLLMGRRVPEMAAISGLPGEDRELVAALMDAMANLRTTAANDSVRSKRVQPLIELADRLRSQGSFRISTLVLCHGMRGYGDYEPLPSTSLVAGREHGVVIYCELENFSSRLNDKKQWETSLTQQSVIYNETGQRVATLGKPCHSTDTCRNRRRDFALGSVATIPKILAPGRYFLKVTITDEQSNQVAEASVGIQLVAGVAGGVR